MIVKLFRVLLLLSLAFLIPYASAESLKESWYMYRGRDNMKIGNYKAAIEAFESATRLNAQNREASHQLGLAYEKQGIIDKAVAQYDTYLAQWPDDTEVALRQARLLKWSRYSYRQQDAIKYYRLSLNHKNDTQVRLEYADTLAAKKETSGQAINEYETVLKSQPKNAAAHRGLAKAYAWLGDRDRALYHSRLAGEYGDKSSDTKKLTWDIEKDRRPAAGIEGFILNQVSSKEFDLSGFRGGAFGKYHLSPFLTLNARGGGETFWNGSATKSGGYFGGGAEYRLSPSKALALDITVHGLAKNGLEGGAQYSVQGENANWLTGFRRELVYDSLLSLVGLEVAGKTIGGARRNLFFVERVSKAEPFEMRIRPYAGWVSALTGSPNTLLGTDFELAYHLGASMDGSGWTALGKTQVMSFQRDQSGFLFTTTKPYAGGYFSPSFYFSQEAVLRYRHVLSESNYWSIEGGPSYHHVSGTTDNGSKVGGSVRATDMSPLGKGLFLQLEAEFRRVADVYTQARLMGWLSYQF